eukprot:CAMPEP_0179467482 /NCGR_PEP_ID=MMETSP0799-20121207/48594_1 /TAXON_ID=46947 /ORGANISM="Geminigera cryophila, Strain CCMP2564" /LENGTH=50 /DNA_ID=CAMNT_0021272901 /DNA_START=142 /DNA_END=294 /DNA_ORIENTATION=+
MSAWLFSATPGPAYRNSEEMPTLAGGSGAVGRADERAYSPPSKIGGAVVT